MTDLGRAMDAGALLSGEHERDLRRAADALWAFLDSREALSAEHAPAIACGDAAHRKLMRLLHGLAELRGQAVELAAIVGLLVRAADGQVTRDEVAAGLLSAFAGLRLPYAIVGPDGIRRSADGSDPRIANLSYRSLAVDDVRQLIWRSGQSIRMGRRLVLYKFLRLLALSPGSVFSQEEIFEKIWGGAYHPLRNSPAVFTTVARLRRLLGTDGESLLRTVHGDLGTGYAFFPPPDYCLVMSAQESGISAGAAGADPAAALAPPEIKEVG